MLTKKEFDIKRIDFSDFIEKLEVEKKYLKKYFRLNSNKIEETNQELSDSLQSQIDENPDMESRILDEYEKSLRAINSYYYHSIISLVHTYFESHIIKLCNLITENTESHFNIELLKGNNNIVLALDYLKLTSGIGNDLIELHMPRLRKFQNLRNKIIHENSSFKNDADMKKLQNGFRTRIDFDESNMRFFINSDELSIEYLNKSSLFIRKIVEHLELKEFLAKPRVINESQ